MIRTRSLALAACLGLAPLAAALPPATAAIREEAAISVAELMRFTALDDIFTQFGPTIESAPAEQGTAFTSAMQAAWSGAAREVFSADDMHAELAAALGNTFSADDRATFGAFFRSEFGRRVSEIEREVATLPPAAQAAARDEGLALAAESGPRRMQQIEEMLELVSAEIATSMVRQAVRGLLIGMSVNRQQGDIAVPWEEIEAQLTVIMPGIEADIAMTQRAMMFFGYRDLGEAELDTYLEFLRTDAAQKFYAVAAFSIGQIIAERMHTFGETIARRLAQVNV
jgi:hypothetical protein